MSKERQHHHTFLQETGRFQLDQDQEDTIVRIMGDAQIELQELIDEEHCTLNLPIIRTNKDEN